MMTPEARMFLDCLRGELESLDPGKIKILL